MTIVLGLITPVVAYAVITLLHVVIPVKRSRGYVTSEVTGEAMEIASARHCP